MTRILPLILGAALLTGCGPEHENGQHHDDDIARIEIVDRGETASPIVATWTPDDGWDGALPTVSLGSTNQRISLGVRAIAEDGDDLLAEDDHLEARYALASGAAAGIVDLERDDLFHGDYFHVYGLAEGTTQIQIVLWHDDHADLSTDPISVTVAE